MAEDVKTLTEREKAIADVAWNAAIEAAKEAVSAYCDFYSVESEKAGLQGTLNALRREPRT